MVMWVASYRPEVYAFMAPVCGADGIMPYFDGIREEAEGAFNAYLVRHRVQFGRIMLTPVANYCVLEKLQHLEPV